MADLGRILISGGHGMIGSNLDFGIKPDKSEFDVTNPESISLACDKYNPSAILSLSSINIRDSEENPLNAYRVNSIGVYHLAREAKKRGIPLIMLSTGSVFNGSIKDSFNEDSFPNPVNIYAQTKYIAEVFALGSSDRNLVIRTGWVFGTSKDSKKGVFDKMLDLVMDKDEIIATYDQEGSPTYIKDLVTEIKKLISRNCSGIYHVANQGRASAVEFVEEAIRYAGRNIRIKRKTVAEFSSKVKRSPSECLNSNKIKLRSWQEALEEHISSNNKKFKKLF
ncbi:hypothetical protein AUJ64_02525 [Candidatus Pacearchaeota archaeon CG1_02_39_14]|nr:MAG: hypothetical protein AUJ64_02525 [Candidatus Pacearchaeota archaeon CG1_02_39_14]